ncbi:hypothetical protein NKJ32_34850, partial [Mesorhizobium sp. M0159]
MDKNAEHPGAANELLKMMKMLMGRAPHVHTIVPGGGIAPNGSRWISLGAPAFIKPELLESRHLGLVGTDSYGGRPAWCHASTSVAASAGVIPMALQYPLELKDGC